MDTCILILNNAASTESYSAKFKDSKELNRICATKLREKKRKLEQEKCQQIETFEQINNNLKSKIINLKKKKKILEDFCDENGYSYTQNQSLLQSESIERDIVTINKNDTKNTKSIKDDFNIPTFLFENTKEPIQVQNNTELEAKISPFKDLSIDANIQIINETLNGLDSHLLNEITEIAGLESESGELNAEMDENQFLLSYMPSLDLDNLMPNYDLIETHETQPCEGNSSGGESLEMHNLSSLEFDGLDDFRLFENLIKNINNDDDVNHSISDQSDFNYI